MLREELFFLLNNFDQVMNVLPFCELSFSSTQRLIKNGEEEGKKGHTPGHHMCWVHFYDILFHVHITLTIMKYY